MLKKLAAVMLTAALFLCCTAPTVSAAQQEPENVIWAQYVKGQTSDLSVSGRTATCVSTLEGTSAVTQVVTNQTLQVKTSSGSWKFVAHWNETDNGSFGYATNTQSNLADGEYRLLSSFTVITTSGSFENIMEYSTSVYVP